MSAAPLAGLTALVTGSTRGLGRVIAEGYASAGARVIVVGRRTESCAKAAAEIAAQTGHEVLPIACNISHWDEIENLVTAAYEQAGRIDIVVNNAGISPLYPSIAEITEELFDKTVAVNLKGPLRLAALAGTRMVADGGGSIINVSSVAAIRPRPDYIIYSAAKAGLGAMTEALAQAYGPTVRVNTIMAGPFMTDISRAWDMSVVGPRLATYPARRAGEPAEILGAALYLADPAASRFTTGATIRVDGGMAVT
jgi:NAD(P)-dependent dehydrogenase (short-subunit alcohol dehydrogenase family)